MPFDTGDDLERIVTEIPGPRTRELKPRLRRYESRNVTYLGDDFPVFWESASGATIVDVDGNRYLDLTAAFGVANAGHSNPRVVAAIAAQAARLMHGMGDVFPNEIRVRLLERLVRHLPAGMSKTYFATTGSDAVEAALKTAMLFKGKPRFAAYHGAYHGLSLGTLPLCGMQRFAEPFAPGLGPNALHLPYPKALAGMDTSRALEQTRTALAPHDDIAAVVIEPIQGRGGCVVPPDGYLAGLRAICDELGILMIADDIFTGFGRTGAWFAVDREGVVPDLLCIGKALASGFPMSAVAGRPEVMDAWPLSAGEALHTATFLGNPMGCAAALATLEELERHELPQRAARLGLALAPRLEALRRFANVTDVRGRGLLWGIQMRDATTAAAVVKRALVKGVIVLQSGTDGDTLSITPPLVVGERQLERAIDLLEAVMLDLE